MKIPLCDWAAKRYSPAPSIRLLRAWAKTGQIFPAPERVGRAWMVEESAVRVPMPAANDASMSDRARDILRSV